MLPPEMSRYTFDIVNIAESARYAAAPLFFAAAAAMPRHAAMIYEIIFRHAFAMLLRYFATPYAIFALRAGRCRYAAAITLRDTFSLRYYFYFSAIDTPGFFRHTKAMPDACCFRR